MSLQENIEKNLCPPPLYTAVTSNILSRDRERLHHQAWHGPSPSPPIQLSTDQMTDDRAGAKPGLTCHTARDQAEGGQASRRGHQGEPGYLPTA